ncbi:Ribosome-binding factor A [Caenispirillum salinarum AK4]|uniref:Ribosome-binding factor A n=1 Tax=Caenispirillum salinarum AK4 TaxID=1238182 RepID=K9H4V5_9PROT|nr:30S ribosome-binding factor RbfA [Caenispirillum salinarum]EKV32104.1 Ribosome-binding factor A [Caenispirillum salinarum AK4]
MTRTRGKAPSQRQLRVGEEIRHALAWTLERGDFDDPALNQPITVTEVRCSPDLRNCTAFVTPLGGGDPTDILKGLKRAAPFLRHELAQKIRMKYVPRLSFQPDESFDEAAHINALLHSPEVERDLAHGHDDAAEWDETEPSADADADADTATDADDAEGRDGA